MNTSVNTISLLTIVKKEVRRFLRIWTQTLLPSAVTQTLYFLIFGGFIGSQIANINGVPYMQFIVPGLVMMAVITNAYSNSVSSFFGAKFQRNIEELLVSPTPNWVIILGFTIGGALRGVMVGIIVFLVSFLFTQTPIFSFPIILLFITLTSIAFALAGLTNGLYAKTFDDVSIVPTFVLTPLTYLGGVFYSISRLPEPWITISKFNPIVYMVDGFRYGFFGKSEISVVYSGGLLVVLVAVLFGVNLYLLNKGTGMRS
jgi:ABC-2 type transport system permease protein